MELDLSEAEQAVVRASRIAQIAEMNQSRVLTEFYA